jgi:hypothetical protein
MSGEEYEKWIRYYNTEPFGAPRREQMHGDLMSSMWMLNSGPKAPAQMKTANYWMYLNAQANDDDELDEATARARLGI